MNRRHQGQPTRNSSTQSLKGQRGGQFSSHHIDQDYEVSGQYRNENRANYSGSNSSWGDDDMEAGRAPSYRDTDYDLDGATYERPDRHSRGMSSYDSYETNDRNRTPARFSSLDEDRNRSWDRSDRFNSSDRSFSQPNRGLDRSRSSSDRFGYPSSMDSWSHQGQGQEYGRLGQGQASWRGSEREQSYGEGSLDREQSRSGFFGKGPKGYRRSDDRIKEDVCETLSRNPRVDASDIEVSVEDACVTLSGTVESKEIKRAAEMAIENLSGVDDVKNEIRVKKADDSLFASSAGGKQATSSSTANTKSTSTKGSSHL